MRAVKFAAENPESEEEEEEDDKHSRTIASNPIYDSHPPKKASPSTNKMEGRTYRVALLGLAGSGKTTFQVCTNFD
jgi:hypothetical protein